MDDQQFCLKWNNHQSTLISVFDSMLQRNLLVDCTLAAEGRTLKAHKVVLSACSPYFENVLTDHYDKHPIVILKDVKYQELEAMMDYMYRGEVNVSQDQLGSLLKTAESLQIKGLSDNRKSSGEDDSHRKRDPPPIKRDRSPEQTLVRNALESKKQEVDADSLSREGSQSPGPRKRKRLRHRTSQDNLDSGVVVLDNHDGTSNASSTHSNLNASSVPAASTSTVPEQETPLRVSSDPSSSKPISRSTPLASSVPQVPVIKEKLEPHSEIMIEPKSEYVEEELNDDNVEDLTVTLDDDDMDMDHSRPGPSHGTDGSNQGFGSWHMTDTSQDETFIAAQDAVGQHRDAQDFKWEFIKNIPGFNSNDTLRTLLTSPFQENAVQQTPGQLRKKYIKYNILNEQVVRPGYSPDSQFACCHCGKRYRWKSTMRRHEQVECGGKEPMYQCPQCPYRAKQKGNLNVHIKKHHNAMKVKVE